MAKWRNGLHLNWERFRYWRSQLGFEKAYYMAKDEHRGPQCGSSFWLE